MLISISSMLLLRCCIACGGLILLSLFRVDGIIRTVLFRIVDDDALVRTVVFCDDDDVDTTVLLFLLLCLVIDDDVRKIGDKTIPVRALASPIAAVVSATKASATEVIAVTLLLLFCTGCMDDGCGIMAK